MHLVASVHQACDGNTMADLPITPLALHPCPVPWQTAVSLVFLMVGLERMQSQALALAEELEAGGAAAGAAAMPQQLREAAQQLESGLAAVSGEASVGGLACLPALRLCERGACQGRSARALLPPPVPPSSTE